MPFSNVAADASILVPEIMKSDTLTNTVIAAVASNSLLALGGGAGGAGGAGGEGGATTTGALLIWMVVAFTTQAVSVRLT